MLDRVLATVLCRGLARHEVRDRGRGFEPQPKPEPREVGGLGMVVLDRMSSSWGVEHDPESVVWFETSGGYRAWSRDAAGRSAVTHQLAG